MPTPGLEGYVRWQTMKRVGNNLNITIGIVLKILFLIGTLIPTTTNASADTGSYLQLVMCSENDTNCKLQDTSECNQTIRVSCIPLPGTVCTCTAQQSLFTLTHVQYITTTAHLHVCPTACTCGTALPSDRTIVTTQTRNRNDCESSTAVSTTPISSAPHTEYIHTCTANTLATLSTPTNQIEGSVGGLAAFIAVQFLALIAVTLGWVCTCVQIKLKRSGKYTVTYVKNYIVFA